MKQIRLSQGLYALVDDDDFEWLNRKLWYASRESRGTKWYAIRREKGVKIRMHVEIYKKHWGDIPKGYVIDHVNHNSLDNRKFRVVEKADIWCVERQLEAVTQAENMRRSPGWKKKGVKIKPKLT